MDAGRMRHRITIRRQANSKNARGGLARSWTTVAADLSAEVLNIDGHEALIGQVLQGVSRFQITVRFREDIIASDQILWGSRELNVHSADDRLGTRQWLVIIASNSAPQGA